MRGVLFAAACLAVSSAPVQAAKPEPLPMPVAQQLPVDIVLGQQELAVEVPASGAATGAAVGGILGALIGTAIDRAAVSNAEERVVEIRNLLVDYPFSQKAEAALRVGLASEGLSPEPVITSCDAPAAVGGGGMVVVAGLSFGCSVAPSKGVLVVAPRYVIDNRFQNLAIRLHVALIDREAKSNGKPKLRLVSSHMYQFNYPLESLGGQKPEDNAARWIALGGDQLAAMLDFGIDQTIQMMAYDFSAPGRAERDEKKRGSTYFKGESFNGQQVRAADHWVWTRLNAGLALQGYYPVRADALPAVATASDAGADTQGGEAMVASAAVSAEAAGQDGHAMPASGAEMVPSEEPAPTAEPRPVVAPAGTEAGE